MIDFTLRSYTYLIDTLIEQNFSFLLVKNFKNNSAIKSVILRHDVDSLPWNSMKFAEIQAKKGIRGSYYFRILPKSFNENIIREIYSLGHEIGYHYEDVCTSAKKSSLKKGIYQENELAEVAYNSFKTNLEKLRQIVPISTICMHGSPFSSWDSRLLWKYFNYHDLGIEVEPYFDMNFDEVLYLTDTGRRWNGGIISVRDKALIAGITSAVSDPYSEWKTIPTMGSLMNMKQQSINFQNKYEMRSTNEIIEAALTGSLPNKIMITFHPQRWSDRLGPWATEFIWQNIKNIGKYFLIKYRN